MTLHRHNARLTPWTSSLAQVGQACHTRDMYNILIVIPYPHKQALEPRLQNHLHNDSICYAAAYFDPPS